MTFDVVRTPPDPVAVVTLDVPATAFLGIGQTPTTFPIFGGTLLVVPDTIFTVNLDVFGQYEFAAPLMNSPSSVGQSYFFQAFLADPGGPSGFSMTNGLQMHI